MNIVVLDAEAMNPGDLDWAELKHLGNVRIFGQTSEDLVIDRARDAEILVVNKIKLDSDVFKSLPRLKFISVTATGYDNIDLESALKHEVTVSNAVNYSSESVAQYVLACILDNVQALREHDQAVKDGQWSASKGFSFTLRPLQDLTSLCVGVLGLGNIGITLDRLLSNIGVKVLGWNRSDKSSQIRGAQVSLQTLLKRADIVSMHLPLSVETRGLIGQEEFKLMKKGACLINAGRGALVDKAALLQALDQGILSRAYIDVFDREPPPSDDPILQHTSVVVTPHLAWATVASRERLMSQTVENIKAFIQGAPIRVVH